MQFNNQFRAGKQSCSRRYFLKASTASAITLAMPAWSANLLTKANDPFFRPYVLPSLAEGNRNNNQISFNLKLRQGQQSFFPDVQTSTFGINQDYSGPVIRVRKGDEVIFNVDNQLGETTALHWHGLKLPAAMDGGPHQTISHGDSWLSSFQIRQSASTCWYHSHQHERTGFQVYQGLAGMFIIDDEKSETLEVPKSYGIDDFPILIQDRDFNQDGSFRYVNGMHEKMRGKHGAHIMVNGVITPTLKAERTLMRLRVVNGSNARIYRLAFDDARPFQVIASDGGFLDKAVSVRQQWLSPGERIELVVDVSDRKEIILKSLPVSIGGMGMMGGMLTDELNIMRIDARQATQSPYQLPQTLITAERLNPSEAKIQRPMVMSMSMHMGMIRRILGMGDTFTINGKSLDMQRIDFSVERGVPEIWEISNDSSMPHPFHVHNTQFQILDRNSRTVAAHENGLKDTVLVNPRDKVRILLMFSDYTNASLPYMYHCHNLEHEDQGMMGQFTVV